MPPIILTIVQDRIFEEKIAASLQAYKDELGFCYSLEEGLAHIRSSSNSVRVILLDARLPVDLMTSIEQLRTLNMIPEIIVLASDYDAEPCLSSLQLGVFDYLLPAYSEDDIQQSIHRALGYSGVLRKLNHSAECLLEAPFETRKKLAMELTLYKDVEGTGLSDDELMAFFPLHERLHNEEIQTIFEELRSETGPVNKPVVLVVDDEVGVLAAVKDFLYLQDVLPILTESPRKAIEIAKAHPEIDLLILDIGMPEMNGVDLLDELKHILPEVEAIMLTGYQDPGHIRESFNKSAFDYVMKPYESEPFELSISKALQLRCFRKMVCKNGSSLLSDKFMTKDRVKLVESMAQKRLETDEPFVYEELYAFYPELRKSGVSGKEPVPRGKLQNGIRSLVMELKNKIPSQIFHLDEEDRAAFLA